MTRILSPLRVDFIDNNNHVSLAFPFGFVSDVLKKAGLRSEIWSPIGFVFDFESTPNLIRGPLGENKRGGAAHDIVCRKYVVPGVTKSLAADVYFEIMEYCDAINFKLADHYTITKPFFKLRDWSRRWSKSTVVRFWPGDFFLKYELTTTAKDEAIKQSEETTEGIKAVPTDVEQKADLVKASEQVTEDLKDAKNRN
jgi:hypothetical protein